NCGVSGSSTGTASPVTVGSLTNGKTYTCTVTATNAIGTSPASAPSGAVVPAAPPSAPTITGVTGGDALVVVAFTAGNSNGSAIMGCAASCATREGGEAGTSSERAAAV